MKKSIPAEVIERMAVRKRKMTRLLIGWGQQNSPDYPWRLTRDPYAIMIAEILLRKTRADAVSRVFPAFIKRFPTVRALSHASTEEINSTIYSLGMISRGRDIKKLASVIENKYSGKIPTDADGLKRMLGRGRKYTSNALCCFAYGKQVPIFDVNVARVLGRVFSIDFGKEPHKNERSWQIASLLLPAENIREYNWALLDLGRKICVKNPLCEKCPLLSICDYGETRVASARLE